MDSQVKIILNHLQNYRTITSYEAFTEYRITRLSAIIFILRRNYNIRTVMHCEKNNLGHIVNYAEYILEDK